MTIVAYVAVCAQVGAHAYVVITNHAVCSRCNELVYGQLALEKYNYGRATVLLLRSIPLGLVFGPYALFGSVRDTRPCPASVHYLSLNFGGVSRHAR